MKELVFILILALPFISNGQEKIEPVLKVQSGAWKYVGAFISTDLAFRTLSNNDGSQTSDDIIESRNEREVCKFGYTAGLTYGFTYNRKLGFETGFQYANMGYQTNRNELVFGDLIDPRRGFGHSASGPNTPTHARLVDHFEYVGIPIALKYWSGTEKWRFSASLGASANYLIKASSTLVLYYENETPERSNQTSPTDYEKFNITPFVGAGVEYQLNERMSLNVMPTVRYGVLNIIDAPITPKLYNGGLQFGWNMNM